MLTLRVKNMRDGEIIADNFEDAIYKLAKEKTFENCKAESISDKISLYESIKDKITKVNGYQKISKDEMNER